MSPQIRKMGTTPNHADTPRERQTALHENVPLSKLIPFYGNDPDRTNPDLADFKSFVEAIKAGKVLRGPVRAVFDKTTGFYYVFNGHRTTAASRVVGFNTIDVLAVVPFQDEEVIEVQAQLFEDDNKNRPYKGKAELRTAILTRGKVLMSKSVKKAWATIQKYNVSGDGLDWMAINATPDLIEIMVNVVDFVILARQKDGETTSQARQNSMFVSYMGVIKRMNAQRETRDYVKNNWAKAGRVLERALEKGTVPDKILTDTQKDRRDRAAFLKKERIRRERAKAEARAAAGGPYFGKA